MYFRQSDNITLGFVGMSVGMHVESVTMIIVTSVGSMGRISPAKKREKRKRQKARRKLFASSNEFRQSSVDVKSDDDVGHDAGTSSDGILKDDDVYGVDTTVLEMQIEDGFKEQDEVTGSCTEQYSPEYLQRCRQQLMDKVRAYWEELERERLEKKKLMLETEEQIQNIRTFYTNIALAPTRTGRIAKAALSSTHTAKEFLREALSKSNARLPYQHYY